MDTDRDQSRTDQIPAGSAPLSDSFLKSAVPPWLLTLLALLLAASLYPLSRHNYLLFHTLVEIFFVAVAFTVFSIGWNARKFVRHNALMLLSISFVVIGSLELLHLVSYKGLGIFPDIKANVAAQLWIIARYLEATVFIAAAILLNRETLISPWTLLGFSILVGSLALTLIWPFDIFPVCYIEGIGLTPFKIISEYIISTLFGLAILLFWRNRDRLDSRVLKLLIYSILFAILTELAFTLYTDIYGVTNFIGHFAKFMSVVLLYRVLVIGTLRSPYATLFRDLSQAKETLDLELIQRRKIEADLRIANRELDAFVRTVSHDLRTPLTPIIGLPELMLENLKDQIDEATKKSLQDIRSQGLRMARILEDLLVFARAGHLIDGITPAKIELVVKNVLEDLGSKIVASGSLIEIKELPDIALPRTALFQIFANLIDNAIKYAGKEGGPIEISGELNDDSVILSVCDHGPGIPVGTRKKIFDVFYRGAEQQKTPGTGVGLATVHKIAQCMGGNAWAEETDGGGSTFKVRLQRPGADSQQDLDFNRP